MKLSKKEGEKEGKKAVHSMMTGAYNVVVHGRT